MGAGGERSIRQVAAKGYNLLLGQYPPQRMLASSRTQSKRAAAASIPCKWGCRAPLFVADGRDEKELALERRLQNHARQLRLATQPDGTVLGGPDRAIGDPHTVNVRSTMYGCPEEIAQQLQVLREVGARYILINGGGSGGGARGRESLRRFATEVMPHFAQGATAATA